MKQAIIFGKSPYINEVKDFIPELIKNYDTVGINNFTNYYPTVKYWGFFDKTMIQNVNNNYSGQILITRKLIAKQIIHPCKSFEPLDSMIVRNKNGYLGIYNYTHTFVLNYLYLEGYDEVYLCGVDLNLQQPYNYFYSPDDSRNHSKYLLNIGRKGSNAYNKKTKMRVFNLNPNTDFLPIKYMKELL